MKNKIGFKEGGGKKLEAFLEKGNGSKSGEYCEINFRTDWKISQRTKDLIKKCNNNPYEAWEYAKTYFKYFSLHSSHHFIEMIESRKIPLETLIDTLNNFYEISDVKTDSQGRKSFRVVGYNVIICINPNLRKITTVYPTKRSIQNKIISGEKIYDI